MITFTLQSDKKLGVHRRSSRRSTSFKVTDVGTNRKHIFHFLLVNIINLAYVLSRTVSKL